MRKDQLIGPIVKHSTPDVVVIGAGVAGLSAAIHCAQRGMHALCLEQMELPGGLISNLGIVDDVPWPGPVSGSQYADFLKQRALDLSVSFETRTAISLNAMPQGFELQTSGGPTQAAHVIAASGAKLKQLGVPGESELLGKGVSQCDWCDGGFFRDQAVAVIGAGDAAFQAALHLAQMCQTVSIVMRGPVKARRSYLEAAMANDRITFLWETQVQAIEGSQQVQNLLLRQLDNGDEYKLAIHGVFVMIGTEPCANYLPQAVARDRHGAVVTDEKYLTSVAGLFAIGALRSGFMGNVASVYAQGVEVSNVLANQIRDCHDGDALI